MFVFIDKSNTNNINRETFEETIKSTDDVVKMLNGKIVGTSNSNDSKKRIGRRIKTSKNRTYKAQGPLYGDS